jgi:hypothetical protein
MSSGATAITGNAITSGARNGERTNDIDALPVRDPVRHMHGLRDMNIFGTMCGLALTTTGLLFACGGANQGPAVTGTPESQTGVTSSQKNADTAVVDRLAAARCNQEEGCKNIGPGAKYASRSVCTDQIRGSIGNDLNAYNCPHGLDRESLDRCMAAIMSEECSHPFDTLTRFDKCRTGALCMK